MSPDSLKHGIAAAIVFGLFLFLLFLAYIPGMGAPVMFDTIPNLRTLESVRNLETALLFILTGESGPLGRPISLATFLLDKDSWPNHPGQLIHTNIIIHLVNGALLAWAAYLLGKAYLNRPIAAIYGAILAASIWLVFPILVSTNLLIIQRMSSVAGTFMVLGLVSHMYGRRLLDTNSRAGIWWISISLVLFTGLAALSKENGILLPVLVLVVEAFLLKPPVLLNRRHWRIWQAIFLFVPLLVIAGYLVSRIGYSDHIVAFRGFSAYERFITQLVVLWEYLIHALLPSTRNIGPFHDGYPIYRSILEPVVFLALAGWIALVVSAILTRKRFPLFGFAVFWYLAAHLIESTFIPLEIYFEHRNYVPLMGVAIAIGLGVVNIQPHLRRWIVPGLVMYVALSLVVVHFTTTLWARPVESGEYWRYHNPGSTRAVAHIAQQYAEEGNYVAAMNVLESGKQNVEYDLYLAILQKWISCRSGEPMPNGLSFEDISRRLPNAPLHLSTMGVIRELEGLVENTNCLNLGSEDFYQAYTRLLSNPLYRNSPNMRHSLHQAMGLIAYQNGNLERVIDHFEQALEARRNLPMAGQLTHLYIEEKEFQRGCDFLANQLKNAPLHPYLRSHWLGNLNYMRNQVGRSSPGGRCPDPDS